MNERKEEELKVKVRRHKTERGGGAKQREGESFPER